MKGLEQCTLIVSRVKSNDFFSCDEKSRNFSCEKCVSCDFIRKKNILRVMKNYTIFHVTECIRKRSNFYRKYRFFLVPISVEQKADLTTIISCYIGIFLVIKSTGYTLNWKNELILSRKKKLLPTLILSDWQLHFV